MRSTKASQSCNVHTQTSRLLPIIHTHAHIHAHMHTRSHALSHTHTHSHTLTRTHTHAHTHTHSHTQTLTHMLTHLRTHRNFEGKSSLNSFSCPTCAKRLVFVLPSPRRWLIKSKRKVWSTSSQSFMLSPASPVSPAALS